MKRVVLAGLLISGLSFSAMVACGGGDSGDGDGDGDMGGSSGDGDDGRSNIECVAADGITDATCVNDTDCAEVEDGTYRATAKDCLLNNCLGADDQAVCVADCLVDELDVTAECSLCYGSSAECSAVNCLADCAADGDSPDCVSCQAENGCTQSFFECSGIKVPE